MSPFKMKHRVIDTSQAREVDISLMQWNDIDMEGHMNGAPFQEVGMLEVWAKRHKHNQLLWVIQLGFELELYQSEEMAAMYW